MARIGTWELSEAAVKAALEAIGLMRSDALLIFKGMVKGGMTKPESIRKYLKQVSSAPGNVQIPDALVEILLRSSKCSGVIALLSDQAIAGNRGAICGCFGVGHYELSLALTGRIQNLRLLLSNADGEANAKGTPSDCADVLAQAVCGPILNCLGFTLSPGQVLGPGDSASEVPKGASNGTESVAKDEKESAKLRKKLEALNLESQKSRLELKDAKANSQKLEFELKKATEQITKLKEAHAAEVAAAVEQQVSAIARPWLEEPLAFESMASGFAEDFESVTLLAEKVLKEQTERDRHTGNKLVVEGQLKRLSELRDRLAEAGKSALRPHPDLPKVIAQVVQ